MEKTIASQLSEIVGEEDISTSRLERELYSHDAAPMPDVLSRLFKTVPEVIVRPESAEEVTRILRVASEYSSPVIPRAAASWSLGGVTPVKAGIVLDLVKLNAIGHVSSDGSWVEVDAGVVWLDLMAHLRDKGLTVLSYPTSAPSSTVGGWVSTGGYGIGSLKNGHIGEQIEAMEVVTPRGETLRVSRDSADPQLRWFCGTEGQFGVITKVRLRLRPKPERCRIRGVYVTGHKAVAELIGACIKVGEVPYALKVLDAGLVALRSRVRNTAVREGNLILAAFEGTADEVRSATTTFDQIVRRNGLRASDEELAEAEWQERYYPMRIARCGPTLLGGETLIPVGKLERVFSEITSLERTYKAKIGIEAHVISRGWVLVLAMFLADERKGLRYLPQLALVRDIVNIGLSQGGKPYGVGLWNSVYVTKLFGTEGLKELQAVKKRLDPEGIMNPGKFFRAETRVGIPMTLLLYNTALRILGVARRFQ